MVRQVLARKTAACWPADSCTFCPFSDVRRLSTTRGSARKARQHRERKARKALIHRKERDWPTATAGLWGFGAWEEAALLGSSDFRQAWKKETQNGKLAAKSNERQNLETKPIKREQTQMGRIEHAVSI
jgi:hypothetical protein